MFCNKCGTQVEEGIKFCPNCGNPIVSLEDHSDNKYLNLIKKARNGDEESVSEIIKLTQNKLYFVALSYVKKDADAQDVVQNSYIKAFSNLKSLEDDSKFEAWLTKIVSNTAISMMRTASARYDVKFTDLADNDNDLVFDTADERIDTQPEMAYDQKEKADILKKIIGELSDEQRIAVMMYFYEQMTTKEIAEELGISESTIKARIKYAKDKIKTSVLNLESKHGIKLYNIAPIPFFVLMMKGYATSGPFGLSMTVPLPASIAASAVSSEGAVSTQTATTSSNTVSSVTSSAQATTSSMASSASATSATAAASTVAPMAAATVATGTMTATSAVTPVAAASATTGAAVASVAVPTVAVAATTTTATVTTTAVATTGMAAVGAIILKGGIALGLVFGVAYYVDYQGYIDIPFIGPSEADKFVGYWRMEDSNLSGYSFDLFNSFGISAVFDVQEDHDVYVYSVYDSQLDYANPITYGSWRADGNVMYVSLNDSFFDEYMNGNNTFMMRYKPNELHYNFDYSFIKLDLKFKRTYDYVGIPS